MYKIVNIVDTIRIPPKDFGKPIKESAIKAISEAYEGRIDRDLGLVLTITKVGRIGDGRIIPGDGATYHDVEFEALIYKPALHEVVTGKVSEIAHFGAFVKIGPIDGLVHVSQITDDYVSFNEKTGVLAAKETKRVLKEGDTVRARVVSVSLKPVITESKIGLTMRQPGLGKMEWIEEDKRKKKKKTKATSKSSGGKKK